MDKRIINLVGKRFGYLRVIAFAGRKKYPTQSHIMWLCICDCGDLKIIQGSSLRSGLTTACGCRQGGRPLKHGHTVNGKITPVYSSWKGMMQRCYYPKHSRWKYYGGRGIEVCDSWHDFKVFYEDMGDRPPGKTLDRFPDKNGNYCPDNCRWATPKQQANNSRPRGTC